MDLNIDDLFKNAKQSVSQGLQELGNQAWNTGLGYIEQQAINLIGADKAQHERAAQAAISDQLKEPTNPNSFGSYLGNLAKQPVIAQYGIYIFVGVLGIAAVVMMARGK